MKAVVDRILPRMNWGAAIAIVYVAFAASTLGFVVFALGQPVDLVSADYYARSLQQDDHLAAVQQAGALAPALSCRLSDDGSALIVRIPPQAAQGASGMVTLYRPSNGQADRSAPLALADGVQRVPLAGLARGRWIVQLDWRAAGIHYYHQQALDLR